MMTGLTVWVMLVFINGEIRPDRLRKFPTQDACLVAQADEQRAIDLYRNTIHIICYPDRGRPAVKL